MSLWFKPAGFQKRNTQEIKLPISHQLADIKDELKITNATMLKNYVIL